MFIVTLLLTESGLRHATFLMLLGVFLGTVLMIESDHFSSVVLVVHPCKHEKNSAKYYLEEKLKSRTDLCQLHLQSEFLLFLHALDSSHNSLSSPPAARLNPANSLPNPGILQA